MSESNRGHIQFCSLSQALIAKPHTGSSDKAYTGSSWIIYSGNPILYTLLHFHLGLTERIPQQPNRGHPPSPKQRLPPFLLRNRHHCIPRTGIRLRLWSQTNHIFVCSGVSDAVGEGTAVVLRREGVWGFRVSLDGETWEYGSASEQNCFGGG